MFIATHIEINCWCVYFISGVSHPGKRNSYTLCDGGSPEQQQTGGYEVGSFQLETYKDLASLSNILQLSVRHHSHFVTNRVLLMSGNQTGASLATKYLTLSTALAHLYLFRCFHQHICISYKVVNLPFTSLSLHSGN